MVSVILQWVSQSKKGRDVSRALENAFTVMNPLHKLQINKGRDFITVQLQMY